MFAHDADANETPMQCLQMVLRIEAEQDYLMQRRQQLPSYTDIKQLLATDHIKVESYVPSIKRNLHHYRALRTKLDHLFWPSDSPNAQRMSQNRLYLYRNLSKKIKRAKVDNMSMHNIFQHRREMKLRIAIPSTLAYGDLQLEPGQWHRFTRHYFQSVYGQVVDLASDTASVSAVEIDDNNLENAETAREGTQEPLNEKSQLARDGTQEPKSLSARERTQEPKIQNDREGTQEPKSQKATPLLLHLLPPFPSVFIYPRRCQ